MKKLLNIASKILKQNNTKVLDSTVVPALSEFDLLLQQINDSKKVVSFKKPILDNKYLLSIEERHGKVTVSVSSPAVSVQKLTGMPVGYNNVMGAFHHGSFDLAIDDCIKEVIELESKRTSFE